jgi:hypothetical protein
MLFYFFKNFVIFTQINLSELETIIKKGKTIKGLFNYFALDDK